MEPLIEAAGLSKTYDYTLFENISLKIKEKESIAVMGRSGSGKTTLLHILSSLLKPDSGNVKILGLDIYKLKEIDIEKVRRYKLGIIFQSHYLFKGMTARENIEAATLLSGTKINEDILKILEIEHVIDKKVGDLSGGQQQRVSIARVLSKKPQIIFADEPTGNLDRETAFLVMNALNNYINNNNAALLVVTHDDEIAQKAQKIYHLNNKKLELR